MPDQSVNRLAAYMLGALRAGIPMLKVGGGIQGTDGRVWAMSEQHLRTGLLRRKRPTGKVVVICFDLEVLAEFKRLVEADGHTAVPGGPKGSLIITPKETD